VLVYGDERKLDIEFKGVTLGSADPDFLATSPFRKIPGFRDGDFAISDSSAIIAYLEAKYPDGKLGSDVPEEIARTVWFEEMIDTIAFPAAAPIFFNRIVAPLVGRPQDLSVADKAQAEALPPVLDYLESQVSADGSPLVGGRFGIADIAVGSVLANLKLCNASPEGTRYPNLCGWMHSIHARPAFAKWLAADRAMLGLD